ncbi:hypothetical protein O181_071123 [Austropuccinia psidii MF-1]|uniref:Integrase catalytic domain-containing protein n=1 Tax=Austropuccinia psidii MF-1 TaxID=1389203 RepID=A0A9Q3F0F9_9BASI|nr:hypothetical protein [Austropuccinia psidii MF-1]
MAFFQQSSVIEVFFLCSVWTNICQQLNISTDISTDISTSYHPETDGQTERVDQILEKCLQMYVSHHQNGWHTWIPVDGFAYNNSDHSSAKQSLFFTFYERDPQFGPVQITQDTYAGKLS